MVYYAHGCRALSGHSRRSIESAADAFRLNVGKVVQVVPGTPFPAADLFERLDELRVRGFNRDLRMDMAVAELGQGVEATTRVEGSRMVVTLDSKTYRALRRGDGRARFTLCHELGHAALHGDLLCGMEMLPHLKGSLARGGYPIYFDTEWQANAFAGSLLVPATTLARLKERSESRGEALDPPAVARCFDVSYSAASASIQTLADRLPKGGPRLF